MMKRKMVNKKIYLVSKKKKFELIVVVCNWFNKFRGLMFRRRESARALLFDFEKDVKLNIHSFFVFFSFVAVWLDNENKIIELKIVRPWNLFIFPKKKFMKLVEIPMNNKYFEIVRFLVGDAKHLNT
jgi:uncharacterized membrane protein (UPF0127 family)